MCAFCVGRFVLSGGERGGRARRDREHDLQLTRSDQISKSQVIVRQLRIIFPSDRKLDEIGRRRGMEESASVASGNARGPFGVLNVPRSVHCS